MIRSPEEATGTQMWLRDCGTDATLRKRAPKLMPYSEELLRVLQKTATTLASLSLPYCRRSQREKTAVVAVWCGDGSLADRLRECGRALAGTRGDPEN